MTVFFLYLMYWRLELMHTHSRFMFFTSWAIVPYYRAIFKFKGVILLVYQLNWKILNRAQNYRVDFLIWKKKKKKKIKKSIPVLVSGRVSRIGHAHPRYIFSDQTELLVLRKRPWNFRLYFPTPLSICESHPPKNKISFFQLPTIYKIYI